MAELALDTTCLDDYRRFLAIKQLPTYTMRGHLATFPDEYAGQLGLTKGRRKHREWEPNPDLWDYQRDIARIAIRKRKYAVFADCGLGKTLILLEFAKAAAKRTGRKVLIVSPLMVVTQTLAEAFRFYPDMDIEQVQAAGLPEWLGRPGKGIAITNYEAVKGDLPTSSLGGLVLDESSMLKSHYGKWGTRLISLGRGVPYKLCCTGTPAPNDRIEYANHAVFLDSFSTVNAFLATYFINRGQTQERWALKPHALRPFYRALSHWCVFLTDPATYGWTDNCDTIPPMNIHMHYVDMTDEQKRLVSGITGQLFTTDLGGITTRASLGQIAKGHMKGRDIATNKPAYIQDLIASWPDESTLVWCLYNEEQSRLAAILPGSASITGSTPHAERMRILDDFKSGHLKTLISKPKILGFGLNLQIATRQVFSGLQDSYEQFYQAVKRSNRYGSTRPLNVHIPVTDIEEPMVQNVMRKAKQVDADTTEQERLFRESGHGGLG